MSGPVIWDDKQKVTGNRVTVDPITRLEGHGKIEIFLDDKGDVTNAYWQVPELLPTPTGRSPSSGDSRGSASGGKSPS